MFKRKWKQPFKRSLLLLCSFVCLISLILMLKGTALSENSAGVKASVFEDNRDVLIFLNDEHLQKEIGQKASLSLHHEVDAVSSASIGCTVCHPNGQVTARNEFNIEGKYFLDPETNTAASLKYYISTEMDYLSNSVAFSLVRDFFERNTTLSGTYGYTWDTPHPHGWRRVTRRYTASGSRIVFRGNRQATGRFQFQPDILLSGDLVTGDESKTTQHLVLSWTQVLSKKSIAQANVDLSFINGYQSNPYHIVHLDSGDFVESHPDTRTRRAFLGRLNQALDSDSFLQGSYRYYTDTWGITSHTIQLDAGRYFHDKTWLFDLGFRRYIQGQADFYQDRYAAPQEFMTDDYRLDAFTANLYRAKIIYAPQFFKIHPFLENLHLDATYDHYTSTSGFASNLWQLGVQTQF